MFLLRLIEGARFPFCVFVFGELDLKDIEMFVFREIQSVMPWQLRTPWK